MQEVLIDVTRLALRRWQGRLPTGIDRVGLRYVQHFHGHSRAVLLLNGVPVVLRQAASRSLYDWLLGVGKVPFELLRRSVRMQSLRAPGGASYGGGSRPNASTIAGRWFLNVVHRGLDSPRYLQALSRLRVRTLFMVHDLIPITHPEFCREGEQSRHRLRMLGALGSAHALITNSAYTLKRLGEFAAAEGISMPLAACAPLAGAVSGDSARDPGRNGQHSHFLCLGTIEPRKNHMLLLQIWRRLREQMGDATPKLVLVGQRGWECEHVMRVLQRSVDLRAVVQWRERCTDRELQDLMTSARALLMPSFEEGFGLPIAEALHLGVPVIASDLPVYREFAGNAPLYLDPLDALGWMDAIRRFCADDAVCATRVAASADRPALPTWQSHFASVEALMTSQALPEAA